MVKYMSGGNKLIDKIEINLRNRKNGELYPIYIDAFDTPLSKKWLVHLNQLLNDNYHLEKNFCFFGFTNNDRDGEYIIKEINKSIDYINNDPNIDYHIDDWYTMENSIQNGPVGDELPGGKIIHEHYNLLHRYFEELQGTAGEGGTLSPHFLKANEEERYYIRQLNLLCHEFESWALSKRKSLYLPEWQRPSQLMCWLNAPRFDLTEEDFGDFGIETLNRTLGGVYVGVNKAVGKHHWEVFIDEGNEYGRSKDELTTIAMRSQTQAAGDFDIEWANNPGDFVWMKRQLADFRVWLEKNGFDPDDKSLTIGHPKCGQVDLNKSFGTEDYTQIWPILDEHLDVYSIKTSDSYNEFGYSWDDEDYIQQQIASAHPVPTPVSVNVNNEIQNKTNSTNHGAVDYAENVWVSSSASDISTDDIEPLENIDDDIMAQANKLLGLSRSKPVEILKQNNDADIVILRKLQHEINDIFKKYGV